jgi:hypothetical protein
LPSFYFCDVYGMPHQNEASIAELLRRCKGALELVDTAKSLPGLNSSPGLNTWHVCDDGMTRWFSTYQAHCPCPFATPLHVCLIMVLNESVYGL